MQTNLEYTLGIESSKILGSMYCCVNKDEMVCPRYRNLGGMVVKAKPYTFSSSVRREDCKFASLMATTRKMGESKEETKICIDNHIVQ